ncbi:cytochrome P450 [Corynespora cassiicola Philippines]|uniref:Cytochrome P450 n=1 Tax=Corynespora cassiicola Philippines TaxID=1448308 RepID=A0A2T2P5D1_CORCC|nr:cytochrome P450 [Corynespora cassiicola Philippines]
MWTKPTQEYIRYRIKNQGFPNPHGKVLTHVSEAIFKAQLHPGARMENLSANLLRIIHQTAAWESIPDSVVQERNPKDTERVISLKNWTRYVLLYAVTSCFFGEVIFRVDPRILEYFMDFDEDSWQFTYQISRVFTQKMFRAKTRIQNVFNDYLDLSVTIRSDASWMVLTLESEMRAAGIGSKDISAYLMMLYWVINSNAWKAAFWQSSHILLDTKLQKAIEKQVKPLFTPTHLQIPNEIMDQLEASSLLVAAYNETLRVCTSSVGVRNVAGDCVIGNKILQKGSRLLMHYSQMLMDEKVFGRNPKKFDHHRFLDQPSLAKDPSFRPFSGDLKYCPGRFLAQKEVLFLVSLLFGTYGTKIQGTKQETPGMENKKPSLGMMGPKADGDLYVVVKIDGN